MPSILDEIVAAKRVELAESKAQVSLADLESVAGGHPRPLNLSGALLGGGVRLIAEVKKASPSRGLLMPDFDHLKLAETYATNGAAAISCLTDLRVATGNRLQVCQGYLGTRGALSLNFIWMKTTS